MKCSCMCTHDCYTYFIISYFIRNIIEIIRGFNIKKNKFVFVKSYKLLDCLLWEKNDNLTSYIMYLFVTCNKRRQLIGVSWFFVMCLNDLGLLYKNMRSSLPDINKNDSAVHFTDHLLRSSIRFSVAVFFQIKNIKFLLLSELNFYR